MVVGNKLKWLIRLSDGYQLPGFCQTPIFLGSYPFRIGEALFLLVNEIMSKKQQKSVTFKEGLNAIVTPNLGVQDAFSLGRGRAVKAQRYLLRREE